MDAFITDGSNFNKRCIQLVVYIYVNLQVIHVHSWGVMYRMTLKCIWSIIFGTFDPLSCESIGHDSGLKSGFFSATTCCVKQLVLSNTHHVSFTNPPPMITIHISSLNGSSDIEILPDLGADISAVSKEVLSCLNGHVDNLVPSQMIPRTVNGAKMHPLGKLPVTLLNCPQFQHLI